MNGIREQCLEQLRKAIPEAMELMGKPCRRAFSRELCPGHAGGGPALQDADDLIALAQTEAGRLFSPATARLCAGNWKTASSPSRQTITAWTFIRNFCRAISSSHLVVRRSSLSLPAEASPATIWPIRAACCCRPPTQARQSRDVFRLWPQEIVMRWSAHKFRFVRLISVRPLIPCHIRI